MRRRRSSLAETPAPVARVSIFGVRSSREAPDRHADVDVSRPDYARASDELSCRGPPRPTEGSGEAATPLGFLNYHRDTLRWKCSGLTTVQLSTPMAPSALTLGVC